MDRYCVLCVLNQILRLTDYLKTDDDLANEIFRKALRKSSELDISCLSAPEFAEQIYVLFSEVTGNRDPYKTLKKKHNDMVLKNLDYFNSKIRKSADPLFTAGVYSLMGNIIDYGGAKIHDFAELFDSIEDITLALNEYGRFVEMFSKSESVLFLADNAGEAVLDRLFLEVMKKHNPACRLFYAVRSAPAINDILRDEAEYVGINSVANIIESGSSFAGTRITRAAEDFKFIFDSADLIISKGQGNFETLESEDRQKKILYLFKVKCDIVSRFVQLDLGSLIFAFGDTISLKKS